MNHLLKLKLSYLLSFEVRVSYMKSMDSRCKNLWSRCKNLWRWALLRLMWDLLWNMFMVMKSWLLKCCALQSVHGLVMIQIQRFSLNLLSSSSRLGLSFNSLHAISILWCSFIRVTLAYYRAIFSMRCSCHNYQCHWNFQN